MTLRGDPVVAISRQGGCASAPRGCRTVGACILPSPYSFPGDVPALARCAPWDSVQDSMYLGTGGNARTRALTDHPQVAPADANIVVSFSIINLFCIIF